MLLGRISLGFRDSEVASIARTVHFPWGLKTGDSDKHVA